MKNSMKLMCTLSLLYYKGNNTLGGGLGFNCNSTLIIIERLKGLIASNLNNCHDWSNCFTHIVCAHTSSTNKRKLKEANSTDNR